MPISAENTILVIDDDQYLLSAIGQTLELNNYLVSLVDNPILALKEIQSGDFTAVIADIRMPDLDGVTLLEEIILHDPELPVIMITGHGDIALAVKAMQKGAYDFLEKPVDDEMLLASLKGAVDKRKLLPAKRSLHHALGADSKSSFFQGIIGSHPLMQKLYDVIRIIAKESDPILLLGETGTGKELVARAIHDIASPDGSFVAVNMAALPAEIIESELFGHEKGAFTGAITRKIGRFEYAEGGTLFLDEICSLPIALQAKLLRVLEDCQFTRLGSNKQITLTARIISASNRNLQELASEGLFRKDLLYRINAFCIDLPPLRNRKEDIPLLTEFFRQEYCREKGQIIPEFSTSQLFEIYNNPWPGNIRELRNHVRRLCVFGQSDHPEVLNRDEETKNQTLKEYLSEQEKDYVIGVLKEYDGKVGLAHQALGISRKGLYDKINKFDIRLDELREQYSVQD